MIRTSRLVVIPDIMQMRTRAPAAAAAIPAWWSVAGVTCICAYQPKGALNQAASYVNLATPGTFDAAPGTAPTWDAVNGWTFNGSSQYLTTSIIPPVTHTSIVRFSGVTAGYLFGAYKTAGTIIVGISPGGIDYWNGAAGGGGGYKMIAPGIAAGVLAIADINCYRNGLLDGTSTLAASPGLAIYLGGLNNDGAPGFYLGGNIQAMAVYSDTLSAPQVLSLSTAMSLL